MLINDSSRDEWTSQGHQNQPKLQLILIFSPCCYGKIYDDGQPEGGFVWFTVPSHIVCHAAEGMTSCVQLRRSGKTKCW